MTNKPIVVLKQHNPEEFYRETFNPDRYIGYCQLVMR